MKVYAQLNKEEEILTIDDWFKFCPPQKGSEHWKDKRSAKEMARFWLSDENKASFKNFLPAWFSFDDSFGIPELESRFDSYGKGRQHDLTIISKKSNCIITIEGKADESFGSLTFTGEYKEALRIKEENERSKKLERLQNLKDQYFHNNDAIDEMMYQLLHWFTGSISEAERQGFDKIIMVNQVFLSDGLDDEEIKKNNEAFRNFISLISEGNYSCASNKEIIGPIGNKYTKGKELYIGKYEVELD